MVERISQPSRTPIPREERTEVRLALSYEALKMRSISSAAQISAIFFPIRRTHVSDHVTHCTPLSAPASPDRKCQMPHTTQGRKATRLRAIAGGKAATNRRENSEWKMLPV